MKFRDANLQVDEKSSFTHPPSYTEAVVQRCSVKKDVLRNFAKFIGKHLCQNLNFIETEILALVFSCEFHEISKNAFLHRAPLVAASACSLPSFSKNTSRLLLPKSLWKCASTISFRKYKRVTCNLPVQLQFLEVKSMLKMQLDVFLGTVFIK